LEEATLKRSFTQSSMRDIFMEFNVQLNVCLQHRISQIQQNGITRCKFVKDHAKTFIILALSHSESFTLWPFIFIVHGG